jgi:hypothetical protein
MVEEDLLLALLRAFWLLHQCGAELGPSHGMVCWSPVTAAVALAAVSQCPAVAGRLAGGYVNRVVYQHRGFDHNCIGYCPPPVLRALPILAALMLQQH